MTLCVLLWAHEGYEAELGAYEDDVLALIPEHGGTVVSRVRRLAGQTDAQPLEVQVIDLPGEEALAACLADPRRLAVADVRDRVVARTEVVRVAHCR